MRLLDDIRTQVSAAGEPVMEHRLYRLLCLAAAFLCIFVVLPVNYLQNLSWILDLVVFAFGVACLGLYAAALRGRYPLRSFALLLGLVLNLCWFTDAGSQGSIGMFFFTGVMVNSIFFRGRQRLYFLGGFLLNVLALFTLDYLRPAASIPFDTPLDRYLDLVTGFVVSAVACLLMLWVLVSSHDEEQRKLSAMNRDLQRSLDEIKVLQGLLPICGWCKKVRDDEGLWTQVEHYFAKHTDLSFTHGMCPECSAAFKTQDLDAPGGSAEPKQADPVERG
ncbi:MAG TPA: hypothetical protein VJ570_13230 [Holophagaceae bacterium]|nr:hypothetical protein [Holophagaceae bacterium]